ncbi:hypothetical protein CEUSTIGMA_g11774.t1 [Chlamydomonas eustigma]|uniref:BTB domain-containing protein n=1 Tax=Chlamydomonas eustigma TaxID=1157962 RepID=A0A250XN64_9CHLO|nr:hypothetical protein CEUSTIGMA_g11774.t1 [Chlamydomonas eustigma]|eukprot:GAX84352.1 hypothetical protein CEUSTIGMA_g11774.t1 [Chlamydomonas eustigma]
MEFTGNNNMSLSSSTTGLRLQTPVNVYQDSSRSLYLGLEKYHINGHFSDVVVLTPNGKRIKCHQLVLASCSKKFAGALESGDFAGQELPVQGVDSEALETVIRFFYTGECPITVSTAVPLLDAAIKLEVAGLSSACEQFVNQLLHPLTAVTFLEQSLHLKLDGITEVMTGYICSRFEEVTTSHTFSKCDYKTFVKILLDSKHRQPEPLLFKAASKWILADNGRVELAEEVFRLLGISQTTVQLMVKQSTMQLLQNGAGPATAEGSSTGTPSGLLLQQPSGVGVLSDGSRALALAGLNPVQLLQNGAGMPLSAPLSLQLQQQGVSGNAFGLTSMTGQDPSPMLLTLMNGNQLQGGGVGIDRGGLSDIFRGQVSSPGNGAVGAGQQLKRGQNYSSSEQELGESSGKWQGSGEMGSGGRKDPRSSCGGPAKRGSKKEELQQQHSPSSDWGKGSNHRALNDFGMDQIHEMPTIGNHPPPMKGVCHVDNCNADLTQLRDYHQRFKICDFHLKVSSIMKDGVPQRFCQQCGRFHLLSEFDGNKRSCRARLQRHNARRRKRLEVDINEDEVGGGSDGEEHEGRSQMTPGQKHKSSNNNTGASMTSTQMLDPYLGSQHHRGDLQGGHSDAGVDMGGYGYQDTSWRPQPQQQQQGMQHSSDLLSAPTGANIQQLLMSMDQQQQQQRIALLGQQTLLQQRMLRQQSMHQPSMLQASHFQGGGGELVSRSRDLSSNGGLVVLASGPQLTNFLMNNESILGNMGGRISMDGRLSELNAMLDVGGQQRPLMVMEPPATLSQLDAESLRRLSATGNVPGFKAQYVGSIQDNGPLQSLRVTEQKQQQPALEPQVQQQAMQEEFTMEQGASETLATVCEERHDQRAAQSQDCAQEVNAEADVVAAQGESEAGGSS